jgi:hypothetical protein
MRRSTQRSSDGRCSSECAPSSGIVSNLAMLCVCARARTSLHVGCNGSTVHSMQTGESTTRTKTHPVSGRLGSPVPPGRPLLRRSPAPDPPGRPAPAPPGARKRRARVNIDYGERTSGTPSLTSPPSALGPLPTHPSLLRPSAPSPPSPPSFVVPSSSFLTGVGQPVRPHQNCWQWRRAARRSP